MSTVFFFIVGLVYLLWPAITFIGGIVVLTWIVNQLAGPIERRDSER